jgi:hypothetical protein
MILDASPFWVGTPPIWYGRRDPAATEIRIQVIYPILWPPTLKGKQPDFILMARSRSQI